MSRRTVVALVVIVAAGFLLRLAPIASRALTPPFTLGDPDYYAYSGAYVADHPGQWSWVGNVVQFGNYLKAPLYPAMMCVFAVAWRGGFPLNVAVFQMLLGTAAGFAVFWLGRRLHSDRAGLIATALYMFYLPNYASQMFGQEGLFIPLSLAAMALHVECVLADSRPRAFAAVGVLYGLTALTRSLPLYYLPPVAALQVYWAADRRRGAGKAAVMLAAFFVTLLPYSAFISSRWGQFVFVDTQGIRYVVETYSDHPRDHPPGMVETLTMVGKAIAQAPVAELSDRLSRAKAFFYLRGGQWLQTEAPRMATAAGAAVLKAGAHVTHDLLGAIVLLAAPFGLAFARDRRVALLLAAWPAVALPLMIAFLWSGGRYTASFMPQLMIGAGVALAGAWRKPVPVVAAVAALCTVVVLVPVVLSVPLTAGGRADYGVAFRAGDAGVHHTGSLRAAAGFNVMTDEGRIDLRLTARPDEAGRDPSGWYEVRVDGEKQAFARCVPGGVERIALRAAGRLAFVEVRVLAPDGRLVAPPVNATIDILTGLALRFD